MNPTLGLRLDALLRAAGLSTPVVAGMTRAVRGETDGSRMLAGIVTTMLPLIVRTGVADEAEIDVDTLGERLAAEMVGSLVVPATWSEPGGHATVTGCLTTASKK